MLLFLEAVFLHGFLLFSVTFQSLYELNCFITLKGTAPGTVEEPAADLPLWGLPRNVEEEPVEPAVPYVASVITDEQDAFFAMLSDGVNKPETEKEVVQDDMLLMEEWQEDPEPVAVSTSLATKANAKINDYKLGEQIWVVEVIGEEQGYLHVSDGSGRAWIDSSGIGTFSRKDILSVLVDRKTDMLVDFLAAEMLQEYSNEFSMADELESISSSEMNEIYIA